MQITHAIESQNGGNSGSCTYLRDDDAIVGLEKLHKHASWDGASQIQQPEDPVSMAV